MGMRGCCRNNAKMEHFGGALKYGDIKIKASITLPQLRSGVQHYVNFCNTRRVHSALQYKTPDGVYSGICNSANRGYISSKPLTPIFQKKLSSPRGQAQFFPKKKIRHDTDVYTGKDLIMLFTDGRKWFHEKRYGMFVHWGIYAVGGMHEQEQMRFQIPADAYKKYMDQFNPVKFDPVQWLDMFQENGMEYLVFTAKHHDGFCMWDTKETPFNIMNTPYKKDIVGMLAQECQKRDFPLEIYYSCVDWHHKAYPNLGRHHEIETDPQYHDMDEYMAFLKNQIRELCSNYGPIHGIWWDVNVPEHVDESVHDLIRSLQPCAVINNRGYGKGDYSTPERSPISTDPLPFSNPVEACDSISQNGWGYNKDGNYAAARSMEQKIAGFTALGANFLLNAGPKPDGTFPERAEKLMGRIGRWYKKVAPALRSGACPGIVKCPGVLCTGGGNVLNLILTSPPDSEELFVEGLDKVPLKVEHLNTGNEYKCTLDPTVRTLYRGRYLRILNMPVEEMQTEIQVLRLTFDPSVNFSQQTATQENNAGSLENDLI